MWCFKKSPFEEQKKHLESPALKAASDELKEYMRQELLSLLSPTMHGYV